MRSAAVRNYPALPEGELVGFAQAGDGEAFRAIMQRCNQRLFRVARGLMRDETDAEDLLQETYLRAFAAIASFRGEAAIATWLTRILLNEGHVRLRARRAAVGLNDVEPAQASGQVLPLPGSAAADPEADAARAQVLRLIETALDDLPEAFRLVFILREVEEFSIEETAVHLGIRPQTVKTRLHRARRRLRGALDSQLADVLVGAYPFLGVRCARITERVLSRMALGVERPVQGMPS